MNVVHRFGGREPADQALVTANGRLTYGELDERVGRWRGGLVAAGVGRGDRVAIISGNDDVAIVAHLAVLGAGAVSVPLNPRCPPPELSRELAAVGPAAVIVGSGGEPVWSNLDDADLPRLPIADLESASPAAVAEVAGDDHAVLLFTSGTAGMPRPAVLTHANLNAGLDAMGALDVDTGPQHVVAAVIPLFHVFGLVTVVGFALGMGATLVVEEFTTPAALGQTVLANGVTILGGPPTLWWALSGDPGLDRATFGSVVLAVSGAAKLPGPVATAAGRLGLDVAEGYGLTETCGVVATAVGDQAPVGSVGRLVPGVEARLVGADGDDVLVGDPGELWIRGPMVSPGYATAVPGEIDADDPSRTADGWLRTGDVAIVDDDGRLAIVDRVKDIVIVSGFNVYPGEVEAALVEHPGVAQAAIVGEPDEATGERLVAFVVPAAGAGSSGVDTLDLDDVQRHCRTLLARYKVPSRFEVRGSLPTGAVGKLRRRELR